MSSLRRPGGQNSSSPLKTCHLEVATGPILGQSSRLRAANESRTTAWPGTGYPTEPNMTMSGPLSTGQGSGGCCPTQLPRQKSTLPMKDQNCPPFISPGLALCGWLAGAAVTARPGQDAEPRALPAADGKLWRAEAGEKSEGRPQQGQSPARPSAPGTTALSLWQGAATSPSGGVTWRDRRRERPGHGGKKKAGDGEKAKGRSNQVRGQEREGEESTYEREDNSEIIAGPQVPQGQRNSAKTDPRPKAGNSSQPADLGPQH